VLSHAWLSCTLKSLHLSDKIIRRNRKQKYGKRYEEKGTEREKEIKENGKEMQKRNR
jgi:hypothetical protein